MPASDDCPDQDLRSYGRRRGRKLSPRQQGLLAHVLPRLALDLGSPPPANPASLFTDSVREVWLEIGFGGGEHLIWQAEHHADVGIIGCEPFVDGVVKVLSAIDERGIGNVRLWMEDARTLLRWLPDGSIGRVFVLFPDPWPKKRHGKRRLIAPATLSLLARVMRAGAELRIATDSGDYLRTILLAIAAEPAFAWQAAGPGDWRQRGPDWPATRYEQKAARQGRRSTFLCFKRG
jgi:tRNA (guanine-N7-)-methyltransferase